MNCTKSRLQSLKAAPVFGRLVTPNSSLKELSGSKTIDKFDPLTVIGKAPKPRQATLPHELATKIGEISWQWTPQELRQRVAAIYASLKDGTPHKATSDHLDVSANITGLFLQNYISLKTCLAEVHKRLTTSSDKKIKFQPKSVLDVGFGPGTGILVARELWPEIEYEKAVIYGDREMKKEAKRIIDNSEKVVFVDELPSDTSPQTFDLIICQHQLYTKGENPENKIAILSKKLGQLLNPGGVLLFAERGDPLGFESIASARRALLLSNINDTDSPVESSNEQTNHQSNKSNETPGDNETVNTSIPLNNSDSSTNSNVNTVFKSVAPCNHDKPCPLSVGLSQRLSAKNPGKFNWCTFDQNIKRPKYTLELKRGQYLSQKWVPGMQQGTGGSVIKGNGRTGSNNYEIANFSWVSMQKELQSSNQEASLSSKWPRIMKDPMNRHNHATMEVCTDGKIQHWTVPKSQGKQCYHDIRRAQAMDLWPFDAKTKQDRGGVPEKFRLQ